MILAIDIGNTNTNFGIFHRDKIIRTFVAPTSKNKQKYCTNIKVCLDKIYRTYPDLNGAIICSVVPKATMPLRKILENRSKHPCLVVGKDILVPIQNKYSQPKQVGQDRLVGAYAALNLYGLPLIIIDLGTAITLDVVSIKKEYLGGIILPGIRLSLEALFEKTALLPLVEIRKPKRIIGQDTQSSILSGIFFGYGIMLQGLIDLLKKEISHRPRIILTGGNSGLIKAFLNYDMIDSYLILKGLNLLWKSTHI